MNGRRVLTRRGTATRRLRGTAPRRLRGTATRRARGTASAPVALLVAAALLAACSADAGAPSSAGPVPQSTVSSPAASPTATTQTSPDAVSLTGTAGQSRSLTAAPARAPIRAVPLAGVHARCPNPARMTTRALLAQTLMIGVDGASVAQVRRLGTGSTPVGGLFLSGNPTTVLRDGVLRRLGSGTLPPLVAVDEEGGRVQRIDQVAGSIASPQRQARLSDAALKALAVKRGRQLRSLGVTVDLAPVVDLRGGATVIRDRAYGSTPAAVVDKAGTFAAGLRQAGVLPALKHFPGHGRAVGDSHKGTATTPPLASLRAHDLTVYPALLDDGPALVMVGHLTVPGLSTRYRGEPLPTSLDPAAYALLRREFGFEAVAITDELSMRAVSRRFDHHLAVRRALRAGADLALVNIKGTSTTAVSTLLRQLEDDVRTGRLPIARVRQAAARVMAVKGCG